MKDCGKLLVVIWDSDGRLHAAYYEHCGIDIYWCKRDECYYWNETSWGCGTPALHGFVYPEKSKAKVWFAEGVEIQAYEGADEVTISPDGLAALGYSLVEEDPKLDLDSDDMHESDAHWCAFCDDYIPNCDHFAICQHFCYECMRPPIEDVDSEPPADKPFPCDYCGEVLVMRDDGKEKWIRRAPNICSECGQNTVIPGQFKLGATFNCSDCKEPLRLAHSWRSESWEIQGARR